MFIHASRGVHVRAEEVERLPVRARARAPQGEGEALLPVILL